jgi:hypothetical protein
VAETGDGSWTFRREGLLRNRVTIRSTVTGETLGAFRKSNWRSCGELELASGRKYQVTPNGWMTKLQITAADGQPVLRFHSSGVIHCSSRVEVSPTGAAAVAAGARPSRRRSFGTRASGSTSTRSVGVRSTTS